MGLATKKCTACEGKDAKPLSTEQANKLRNQVPGWQITEGADGVPCLRQDWKARPVLVVVLGSFCWVRSAAAIYVHLCARMLGPGCPADDAWTADAVPAQLGAPMPSACCDEGQVRFRAAAAQYTDSLSRQAACSRPDTGLQVRNFKAGLELFQRIGAIAEEEGHHPDLHLESWNKVRVVLSTHSIGAALATQIALCCGCRRPSAQQGAPCTSLHPCTH